MTALCVEFDGKERTNGYHSVDEAFENLKGAVASALSRFEM